MVYFMDTVETVKDGVGFSLFDGLHLVWLGLFLALIVMNLLWYRRMGDIGRDRWKKVVALLLIADELFKTSMLLIGGRFRVSYLPFHLCSINIFMIAIHAWKPSRLLDGFLYTVGIPGAIAALLFPTWTQLPLLNFMHIHSFTVHILLALYPIVLAGSGELRPMARKIPQYLLFLVILAIPVLGLNLLLDTNFMFLMYAEEGNPLYWFAQNWGSHLLGFPVLIAAVLIVMYVPMEIYRSRKRKIKV